MRDTLATPARGRRLGAAFLAALFLFTGTAGAAGLRPCPPCREEMPALDRLARETEGLLVLAVSIDARGDRDRVGAFMADHGPAVTVGHDPARRVERAFRTVGVPESFLIDREGRIAARWIGAFDPLSVAVRAEVAATLGSDTRTR